MVVISKTKLVEFGRDHADAVEALTLGDIKETFNSVDYVVNDRYVFNIKGNKYRLVAMIFFDIRTIYIRYIDTHARYGKIDCKTI